MPSSATGFSTIVRESHDFSCGILDATGRLVARGSHPGHMGGLPASVHGLFDFYAPADMREGDAFLASHPYHSGCPHANDMVVMAPIFTDGTLIAFAASIGHTPDIGGVAAGSRKATARDLFGEGLQIPPVRFMRSYRLEQATATFVRANSRVPEMMIGDLTAKVGVCHTIGEARLHDLVRTYGAPALLQQFDQAGERTAHRISEQLAAWPDGVCEVEAEVDDPSTGEPIRLHVASIKEGQRLVLDFTGTGDQATAPINLRPHSWRASRATWPYASPTANPPQPRHGAGRRNAASAGQPARSCIPGPVGFYSKTLALAESVIGAVMAKASGQARPRPHRHSELHCRRLHRRQAAIRPVRTYVRGRARVRRRQRLHRRRFARQLRREVHQRRGHRVRVPCRHDPLRGAPRLRRRPRVPRRPGYVREYRVRASSRLSGGAAKREAAGVEGGSGGRNAWVVVHPGEEREQRYPGIVSNIGLEPGDVFRIETGGGGGPLPPAERDPARTRADIADGVLIPAKARDTYGARADPRRGRLIPLSPQG